MAKKTTATNVKGILDIQEDTITEITKDAENVYSLSEILGEYDTKQIVLSIKEEQELAVKEEE